MAKVSSVLGGVLGSAWVLVALSAFAQAPLAPTLCPPEGCPAATPAPPPSPAPAPSPAPPPTGRQPYAHYPALDLAEIPWANAAGPWGAIERIVAAAPPVTTRTVNVASASELASAAGTRGTRVVVTASFTGGACVEADDVDVVVGPGLSTGIIRLDCYPFDGIDRVRISGGGRIEGIEDPGLAAAGDLNDVILDGIDIGAVDGIVVSGNRWAIVNTRVHAEGFAFLGSINQLVIAGSSIFHGARTRAEVGHPEGWGVRNRGTTVIFNSDIRGTRYGAVRVAPPYDASGVGNAWLSRNLVVENAEGAGGWCQQNLVDPGTGASCVITNSDYYLTSAASCGVGPYHFGGDERYLRYTGNRYFGKLTASQQQSQQSQHPGDADMLTGNTFSPWQSPPAWRGAGDATRVSLPNGHVPSNDAACPPVL